SYILWIIKLVSQGKGDIGVMILGAAGGWQDKLWHIGNGNSREERRSFHELEIKIKYSNVSIRADGHWIWRAGS
ncbi:hypothetical protein, partial [Sporomusa sp.]|uniref:hypothetical protein n=1 Tax=Sporomusa sp. TaxID=2078658 RepID=UPI002D0102F4